MRAVALTCMEFKGQLIIKVDACEEVRQAQAGSDIFISRMRAAKEEARKVNTDASDWYAVPVICSHKSVVIMAYTQTRILRVAPPAFFPRRFLPKFRNIIADYLYLSSA